MSATTHPSATDGGRAGSATDILHATSRGIVGAMAMSGMRELTVALGLVDEPPPRAIARQRSKGVYRLAPRKKRRAAVELMHWGYGAAGGALFGMLPDSVRSTRWVGPVYGLVLWLGFEAVQAPLMGLEQAKERRAVERTVLAADHLLYGLVLTEMRARPQA